MTSEQNDRRKIEAVLYTTGKFMTIGEIADACGLGSVGFVKEEIQALQEEYKEKHSALEIQEYEEKFKLNIKQEYGFLANKLLGETEFDGPTMKTLALIAYKNPVLQSDVIAMRGNKAYEHIRQLKEDGLVMSEPKGRSRLLKLTHKFFEYFAISEQAIKEDFQHLEEGVRKKVAYKMGTTPEQVTVLEEQVERQKDVGEA